MSPASRNIESSTSQITTDNVPNKSWQGTRPPGHPATTNSGNRYTICTCRYTEANSLQRQDPRVSNCNLHLLQGLMHSLCEGGEACKNPLTRNQSDEESVEPDKDTDEQCAQIKLWLLVDCNINVNKVICLHEWNFYFSCTLCS